MLKHTRLLVALTTISGSSAPAAPLFPNSVVSNDIDFITTEDPSALYCLLSFGTSRQEMPDERREALFADDVQTFEAWFTDGTAIGIWVHPEVGDFATARQTALKAARPLGRLPSFMREGLNHVVINAGDHAAFAEDAGQFFGLYADNMDKRISTHDLEETIFHESVHATLDLIVTQSDTWRAAQSADSDFVTEYAAANPTREDLAETALFAFAYHQHPERLPDTIRTALETTIPNRLALLEELFGADQEMQRQADGLEDCPTDSQAG